jgi:hypothetical protein
MAKKNGRLMLLVCLFCVLSGCEQAPYELWIDDACSHGDQKVIRDSVATVNAWTMENIGEALIEIGGVDAVDHTRALTDEMLNPNSGKRDFVVCLLREEIPADQLERWEPLFGWAVQSGNIILLIEPLEPETFRRRVLHELGHFIGLSHVPKTDPRPAIMHAHPTATAEGYTVADTELLCSVY